MSRAVVSGEVLQMDNLVASVTVSEPHNVNSSVS